MSYISLFQEAYHRGKSTEHAVAFGCGGLYYPGS